MNNMNTTNGSNKKKTQPKNKKSFATRFMRVVKNKFINKVETNRFDDKPLQ